jgi:transcriptional regulator with XRE-family HTH domain
MQFHSRNRNLQIVRVDPKELLGQAIRERRKSLGLTQGQLAEKADLHWTYISGIERGERNVSMMKLYQIALALKTRVSDLVSF